MKIAVISYDLKQVKADDNQRVKAALLEFTNTYVGLKGYKLSPFLERIVLRMPDTTISAEVTSVATPETIAHEVILVIQRVGAIPDKVYVAFIEEEYLWNAKA
jgi:hypothetical protein